MKKKRNLAAPQPYKRARGFYVEAVTVCVDYADFLAETIEQNLVQLDDWVVVTSYDDRETQRLCNEHSVRCVKTDVFTDLGDSFNKARGINLGLSHLRQQGWVLHLDADIALPNRFRHQVQQHVLDETMLYGADRIDVLGKDRWEQIRQQALHQFRNHYLVHADTEAGRLGCRLLHDDHGYCPIGYFQMWHSSQAMRYPTNQGSAEHTDVLFAVQWPRARRRLLPELFVYHLMSSDEMAINWQGRRSQPFDQPMSVYTK